MLFDERDVAFGELCNGALVGVDGAGLVGGHLGFPELVEVRVFDLSDPDPAGGEPPRFYEERFVLVPARFDVCEHECIGCSRGVGPLQGAVKLCFGGLVSGFGGKVAAVQGLNLVCVLCEPELPELADQLWH